MTLHARMEKMVSFRLSADEYQKLLRLCEDANSRSVSDVARTAIEHWLRYGSAVSANNLQQKVVELEHRVGELSTEVERLSQVSSAAAG